MKTNVSWYVLADTVDVIDILAILADMFVDSYNQEICKVPVNNR